MATTGDHSRWTVTTLLLLFLALFGPTLARPLDTGVETSISDILPRDTTSISEDEYVAYLKKYFPATNRYLQYTGGSEQQVIEFKKRNAGYFSFDNMFNAIKTDSNGNPIKDAFGNSIDDPEHPWYKNFHPDRLDDGEAASRALARTASEQMLVFGGIEYQTLGKTSFFTVQEAPLNRQGVKDGRLKGIYHMAKDALNSAQIMAKEDADGRFTWQAGYKLGDKNATGPVTNKPPNVTPKSTPPSSPKSPPGSPSGPPGNPGGEGSRPASPISFCRKI